MQYRKYRIERHARSNRADAGLCFAPLLRHGNRTKVDFMGHSKGRDNAKKRARRRKKTDRLALAKQASSKAPARQGEKNGAK
jgi:hypothetical protein